MEITTRSWKKILTPIRWALYFDIALLTFIGITDFFIGDHFLKYALDGDVGTFVAFSLTFVTAFVCSLYLYFKSFNWSNIKSALYVILSLFILLPLFGFLILAGLIMFSF